jgi:hypothetical protein
MTDKAHIALGSYSREAGVGLAGTSQAQPPGNVRGGWLTKTCEERSAKLLIHTHAKAAPLRLKTS